MYLGYRGLQSTQKSSVCWRRQGGRGVTYPLWVDVQKLGNMCVLSLSWNFFVSHDKYIARPSSNVDNLIHRQYSRDWATSYCRPPIDPYLPPPCYKILAAPLVLAVSQWRIQARRPSRPLTKRVSTSVLVPTSTHL